MSATLDKTNFLASDNSVDLNLNQTVGAVSVTDSMSEKKPIF